MAAPGPIDDCSSHASAADVAAIVAQAEQALSPPDHAAFLVAMHQGEAVLPCVETLLYPADAAAWLRIEGIGAFLDRDTDAAVQAFAAARAAQPAYDLPPTIFPEGHPVRGLFATAEALGAGHAPAAPRNGILWVNGVRGGERHEEEPCILQLTDGAGRMRRTLWLASGEPDPDWTTLDIGRLPPIVSPPIARFADAHFRPGTPVAAAATGAGLVATAVTLSWAAEERRTLLQNNTGDPTLNEAHAASVNRLWDVGLGLGAVTVALVGTTLLTLRW